MELYLIQDQQTGIYYIKDNQPFFYAFREQATAEKFCVQNNHAVIHEVQIQNDADDAYLIGSLYQLGYKGGFIDGVFRPINMTNPDLFQMLPTHSALLHLVMYERSGDLMHLKDDRLYFFVQVTEDGYLAFANTNGNIFAFTDIDNIDAELAGQLYQLGYEVIRYGMDAHHAYFVNPRKATQVRIPAKEAAPQSVSSGQAG